MLVKGTEVIGAKVFTIDEGEQVEDVDDVIYNPQTNRVEALLVSPSGIFSEAKLILLKDARGVGKDAVLIQNKDIMKNSSDIPSNLASIATKGAYLTENRIISESGVDLGKVVDILFDSQSGKVEEFEVSQGLRDVATGRKRVKVSDIITVGKDAVIVKGYTEEKVSEQAKSGGVVGAVNKGAETIRREGPKYYEQAKTKAQEYADRARSKAEEYRQKPETQKTINEAKIEAKKLKGQASETYQRVKGKAKEAKRTQSPKVRSMAQRAREEAAQYRAQAQQTTRPKSRKTTKKSSKRR